MTYTLHITTETQVVKDYWDGEQYGDWETQNDYRGSKVSIADKGGGLYSHWGAEHVIFSALDNSNPMTNGRTYTAQYRLHMRGSTFAGILLIVAASLIWLFLPEFKRWRGRRTTAACR